MARHVALVRHIADHQHQRDRHQQAGNDAGEEQAADRDVGRDAVDHHRQRRRDDRADRGGCRRDRGRGFGVVALVAHRLDLERADAARVGDRRAGHAGEDHAAEDVGVAQPAAQPADAGGGKGEDPLGDAGGVHDVAHQDEQRRGEQRKRIGRLRDLLRDDAHGEPAEGDEREGREPHGGEQRDAEQQRQHPDAEDFRHQDGHRPVVSGSGVADAMRPRAASISWARPCRTNASASAGSGT